MELPYSLSALDQYFLSLVQLCTLSSQPKLLTAVDRLEMALRPHKHIPIVSWTMEALRLISSWNISRIPEDMNEWHLPSQALSTESEKFPSTSAYTPITSARVPGAEPNVDFEYLINNKIFTSTVTHDSCRIADNQLEEQVFPKIPSDMQGKFKFLFYRLLHTMLCHTTLSLILCDLFETFACCCLSWRRFV